MIPIKYENLGTILPSIKIWCENLTITLRNINLVMISAKHKNLAIIHIKHKESIKGEDLATTPS